MKEAETRCRIQVYLLMFDGFFSLFSFWIFDVGTKNLCFLFCFPFLFLFGFDRNGSKALFCAQNSAAFFLFEMGMGNRIWVMTWILGLGLRILDIWLDIDPGALYILSLEARFNAMNFFHNILLLLKIAVQDLRNSAKVFGCVF